MKNLIRTAVIIVIAAFVLALVPYQWGAIKRDGGSRTWKSLTWEVTRYHRYNGYEADGSVHVDEGLLIQIFGHTLRDDAESFTPRLIGWEEVT